MASTHPPSAGMRWWCAATDVRVMAKMRGGGGPPGLPPGALEEMGDRIAAYPLSLMASAMQAMMQTLAEMKVGQPRSNLMDFMELRRRIGFDDYYGASERYATSARPVTGARDGS